VRGLAQKALDLVVQHCELVVLLQHNNTHHLILCFFQAQRQQQSTPGAYASYGIATGASPKDICLEDLGWICLFPSVKAMEFGFGGVATAGANSQVNESPNTRAMVTKTDNQLNLHLLL
jgi:hypothetical protein